MTSSFLDPYDYELTNQNHNETTGLYQNIEQNNEDPIVVHHNFSFPNESLVANATSNSSKW